jgi:hypothetical protein
MQVNKEPGNSTRSYIIEMKQSPSDPLKDRLVVN